MNCQEVMELMQRQLDDDLNAQEHEQLSAHIAYCKECAEIFERLKMLSDELTNLPKVVPAYSLVDAILPKLGEIDRQVIAGSGQESTQSSKTIPANQQPQPNPRTRRRFGSQISWKLVSGVVAAGLVLGFAIYNPKNPLSDSAFDLIQSKSTQMETTSEGASDSAGGNANSFSAKVEENAPLSGDMKAQDQKGSASASPAAGAENDKELQNKLEVTEKPEVEEQTATPTRGTDDKNKGDKNKGENREINKEIKKDAPAVGATSNGGAPTAPGASPTGTSADQPSDMEASNVEDPNIQSDKANDEPLTSGAAPPSVSTEKSLGGEAYKNEAGVKQPSFSAITSLMPEETLKSKDDKYLAAIEQHHVTIKDAATAEVIFSSERVWKEGEGITLVEWSEDGKLTYQVSSNQTSQSFQIDTASKTEIVINKSSSTK
ncbi:anti-sigma factor family protein [Paenibacillus eucommiae]|uniref:Putative zinc-finger domain-containing protein n=1 Tax=Paenibacillus eucommiae TaxID=1355755 RepID=A0ABS4IZ71_9BACL|nr:zf-HC2 domain-containing protein [Paenibacillus eucommiae]MBP1992888.1 hypothetical protein [Paenibacillus eucommiae]